MFQYLYRIDKILSGGVDGNLRVSADSQAFNLGIFENFRRYFASFQVLCWAPAVGLEEIAQPLAHMTMPGTEIQDAGIWANMRGDQIVDNVICLDMRGGWDGVRLHLG